MTPNDLVGGLVRKQAAHRNAAATLPTGYWHEQALSFESKQRPGGSGGCQKMIPYPPAANSLKNTLEKPAKIENETTGWRNWQIWRQK